MQRATHAGSNNNNTAHSTLPLQTDMAEKEKETEGGESSDVEITTPSHLRSDVWKVFGFPSKNGKITSKETAMCKVCKLAMKYHTTTSNLRNHVATLHPEIFATMNDEDEPALKQAKITSYVPPATSSRGLPAARQKVITEKLTKFLCQDMRPINLTQGDGFREFVKELNPLYKIPCNTTITDRVVKLYDVTHNNIKELVGGQKIALTTDGWTSLATEAYVTVTAHFITEDWLLKDAVLKTAELEKSHTAENVAGCIEEILRGYGIGRDSILAVTTDNAGNYVNAVERWLHSTSVPCMAHTINLAVGKGLAVRAIQIPTTRLKAAAQHFNKSTTDSYLLEAKQKTLGVAQNKLINDCSTRWNSTYDMVCRAAEQQAPVAAVIMEKRLSHLELSTNEWRIMEKVGQVLEPFKKATAALSTDQFPTGSAVLPLKYLFLSKLLLPSPDDPPAIQEMKTKISVDLKKRYCSDKDDTFMLLNTASYLDPRFHSLVHLEPNQKDAVREKVKRELLQLVELEEPNATAEAAEPVPGPSRPDNPPAKKTALSAMGELFGNLYSQAAAPSGN